MGKTSLHSAQPASSPYITATGGTVTESGDYKIHTFNSSGTFEVTRIGDSPNNEVQY